MNNEVERCHSGDNCYEIIKVSYKGSNCYIVRKNGKPDKFDVYWNIFEARNAIRERISNKHE